ncbi:MAG: MBL fold metallo-hydrolase [Bacteroidota bacterium]|jgi:glyoxylase-like metal-dependent hydrolase (beta-lactamase superfamily II)
MKLHSINAGYFKLDGGAMFGVVPKSIWNKTNPADENNMINMAMRCLLVEYGDRLVLIDNGIGDKQDAKFFGYYFLHGDDSLEKSLSKAGFGIDQITDVFLSHLHFDHCGGSIKRKKDGNGYEPTFPNAVYWSNEDHWKWATQPNAREKASFLKENILPIQESGQLKFTNDGTELFPGFKVRYFNGHTDAMMIPHIDYKGKTVVYMADLLPTTGHIPVPYVMAYDTRPLLTLDEKANFMEVASNNNYVLFLEHDPINECCSVMKTEKGFKLDQSFSLDSI